MKRSGLAAFAWVIFGVAIPRAADATSPVDYAQRNTPFAPGADAAVTPDKKTPSVNSRVQDKRVDKTTIEKKTAPQSDQRAGIEVKESREKNVQAKDSHRPEARDYQKSAFDHRPAAITTSGDTTKPPTVAKYQDSLTAASASNMARFPALDRATSAKINRFVFRKNPTDSALPTEGKTITPVAGGGAISK